MHPPRQFRPLRLNLRMILAVYHIDHCIRLTALLGYLDFDTKSKKHTIHEMCTELIAGREVE